VDVVKTLLDANADVNAKNVLGETVISLATAALRRYYTSCKRPLQLLADEDDLGSRCAFRNFLCVA
jgi:hypothetical protein